MRDSVTILGVPIDRLTMLQAIERARAMLREPRFHHVMTPNNEMLCEADQNGDFKNLLNRTDMNIADSTGLLWASRRMQHPLPERVSGVDFVEKLCGAIGSDHPVFLLGAARGVAAQAADALKKRYPSLHIADTHSGSPRPEDAMEIVKKINESGAHILLVAFGAPQQDLWIDRHRAAFPHIRLAMGVGGTFDFIAGVQKRAPRVLRSMGLEWLWRLILQPSRFPRIVRAVVIFPLKVVRAMRKQR